MTKRRLYATCLTAIACHIALLICAGCAPRCGSPQTLSAEEVRDKLKATKIIAIQDYDKVNVLDQWGWPGVRNASIKTDYDRNYPKRLKKYLGVEIVTVSSDELNAEMKKVNKEEAQKVADMWISDATEVKIVKKKDVVRNARLYLTLNKLLRKYKGNAITMATWHLAGCNNREGSKTNVMLPLSILELSKQHIPCSCQCHIDCLVTMMVGTYLTGGRMGYDGDVLNDWKFKPAGARPKDVIVVAHCGAPINPHGDDRIPYLIRDHVIHEWRPRWAKLFDKENIAVATTVQWPADEAATVVKFDVYRKKVSVFTGTVLDGNSLYKNFPNVLCRNKVVVKIDNPDKCYLLPSNPKGGAFRDWFGSWGCHQVVFYGNIRKQIKQFAELVGFQVVE